MFDIMKKEITRKATEEQVSLALQFYFEKQES